MPVYANGLIGADLANGDVRTSTQGPAFAPGTTVMGSDGARYIYFKSDSDGIAATTRITVSNSTGVATEAATGRFITVAATAANGFGWAKAVENYTAAAGTTTVVA